MTPDVLTRARATGLHLELRDRKLACKATPGLGHDRMCLHWQHRPRRRAEGRQGRLAADGLILATVEDGNADDDAPTTAGLDEIA